LALEQTLDPKGMRAQKCKGPAYKDFEVFEHETQYLNREDDCN
jgi:hypothetical protein